MVRRNDLTIPKAAVRLFRYWCLEQKVIPEYATIDDLVRFGYYLLEEGYESDEVDRCKQVVFKNL